MFCFISANLLCFRQITYIHMNASFTILKLSSMGYEVHGLSSAVVVTVRSHGNNTLVQRCRCNDKYANYKLSKL